MPPRGLWRGLAVALGGLGAVAGFQLSGKRQSAFRWQPLLAVDAGTEARADAYQAWAEEALTPEGVEVSWGEKSARPRLVAKGNVKKGAVVAQVPPELTLSMYGGGTPGDDAFDELVLEFGNACYMGAIGVIALRLLREWALCDAGAAADANEAGGVSIAGWLAAVPRSVDMPLTWPAEAQAVARHASVRRIGDLIDDVEDDYGLLARLGWKGPGEMPPREAWRGAVGVVLARSAFVRKGDADGGSKAPSSAPLVRVLAPLVDCCGYESAAQGGGEVRGAQAGAMAALGQKLKLFGGGGGGKDGDDAGKSEVEKLVPVVEIVAGRDLQAGDPVNVDYALHADLQTRSLGVKSAGQFLEENGFLPDSDLADAADAKGSVHLAFALDAGDPCRSDKELVLEECMMPKIGFGFPPELTFRFSTALGGEPTYDAMQFLRLLLLQDGDTFILEPIFLNRVWDELNMPFSPENEAAVLDALAVRCETELNAVGVPEGDLVTDRGSPATTSPENLCRIVATLEVRALTATRDYLRREREGVTLKEFYQERRLKELGLDKPLDDSEIVP